MYLFSNVSIVCVINLNNYHKRDQIQEVLDRKVDLDVSMPDHPELKLLAEQAEDQLKALDRALFSP